MVKAEAGEGKGVDSNGGLHHTKDGQGLGLVLLPVGPTTLSWEESERRRATEEEERWRCDQDVWR